MAIEIKELRREHGQLSESLKTMPHGPEREKVLERYLKLAEIINRADRQLSSAFRRVGNYKKY